MNKEIRLLRLTTGEDIICKWCMGDPDFKEHTLTNPIVIVTMPGNPGKPPNIGFAPWMPYSKNRSFDIKDENVICVTDALPEFVTQYNTIHSNLDLPVSKLIIPN